MWAHTLLRWAPGLCPLILERESSLVAACANQLEGCRSAPGRTHGMEQSPREVAWGPLCYPR
jgi:hypothetical protein